MYNILIVADRIQLENLKSILSIPKFIIHASDDGEKAVEQLLRIKPDLLIISKDLPHNNCFEICKDLRENETTQKLPIILIDNSKNDTDINNDSTLFNRVITQPFTNFSLLEKIHSVLGIPQANDNETQEMSERNNPNLLENIRPDGLKTIIINTLEQLPNNSCTKKGLATKVLKKLKISIKGSKRRTFEKSLNRVVGILKRQQILKEYKAKNIRLKINPDYLSKQKTQSHLFENFQLNSFFKNETPFKKRKLIDENEYSDEATINSILKKTTVPDLIEKNHNIDEALEGSADEGDQSLLDVLINHNEVIGDDNKARNSYTVIEKVFRKLKERNKYAFNYESPNLNLKFKIETDIYDIRISPLGLQNSILIKSIITFYEPAVVNVLELFSRDDFIGSLSIETIRNQKYYVLRHTLNIYKFKIEELLFIIDQIIKESKKIVEIIDQKL